MTWLSPSSLPSGHVWLSFLVPDNTDFRRVFVGALLPLTYQTEWNDEEGGLSPDEVCEQFREVIGSMLYGSVLLPGDIVLTGGSALPENRLECDGAEYSGYDYPFLFAAIGYTFGGSNGNFKVPDFRDRGPVGEGNAFGRTERTLGGSGGADKYTLSNDELPEHYHGAHDHSTTLLNGGLEAPVPVLTELPGNTGVTGSGQPFDLHTPFLVVRFTIVYR